MLHFGFILAALAALSASPPARGRILLVPIWSADPGAAARIAVAGGAAIVAAGPIAGSVVVSGRRDPLASPLRAAGVAMMAAPASGCGSTDGEIAA